LLKLGTSKAKYRTSRALMKLQKKIYYHYLKLLFIEQETPGALLKMLKEKVSQKGGVLLKLLKKKDNHKYNYCFIKQQT
jgi:hypothetical protein